MPTFSPGQPTPPPVDPLDLRAAKSLSPLFASAWRLWIGQPGVFLVTAAWVVIPLHVILLGLVGNGFHDSLGEADVVPTLITTLLLSTLGSALVTAVHARAVVALAGGATLTTNDAFQLGFQTVWPALVGALVYGLAILGGTLALVIPGIFLSVAGVFTAQHAVLTGTGAWKSLKESIRIVRANHWWRTLGYLIVLSLVGAALSAAGTIPVVILDAVLDHPPDLGMLAVPLGALAEAAAMSWTALVTTLLYFAWRANIGEPYPEGLRLGTGLPGR